MRKLLSMNGCAHREVVKFDKRFYDKLTREEAIKVFIERYLVGELLNEVTLRSYTDETQICIAIPSDRTIKEHLKTDCDVITELNGDYYLSVPLEQTGV